MKAFSQVTDTMWPGVITVPTMATGASDGKYLRAAGIPTYGVQGFFGDRDDVRAHGRDERCSFVLSTKGRHFLYELVKSTFSRRDSSNSNRCQGLPSSERVTSVPTWEPNSRPQDMMCSFVSGARLRRPCALKMPPPGISLSFSATHPPPTSF